MHGGVTGGALSVEDGGGEIDSRKDKDVQVVDGAGGLVWRYVVVEM